MATIVKRKTKAGVSYQAKIRLKGHPVQSAVFRRLTDAKSWAASTESKLREGQYVPSAESRKRTAAELIERYIRDVLPQKKDTKAPARHLAWWKARIGHLRVPNVTPSVLSEARDALLHEPTDWARSKRITASARSPATANRYMASISHVFSVAVREWQWMASNPARNIKPKKEPKGRDRCLSDDERTGLLKACRESGHPFLYPAVVVCLSTGARQGEILGLRWKDVDLRSGAITLHDTKNDETRSVGLRVHALKVMRDLSLQRDTACEWVFPGRPNRKTGQAGPISLRAPWLEALRKAKIDDFRWHDLRHSAASYLAMNGATLAEIAEILGHKQLSMVKRYAHLSPQHTASVVESMNQKIFGEGAK